MQHIKPILTLSNESKLHLKFFAWALGKHIRSQIKIVCTRVSGFFVIQKIMVRLKGPPHHQHDWSFVECLNDAVASPDLVQITGTSSVAADFSQNSQNILNIIRANQFYRKQPSRTKNELYDLKFHF